MTCAHLLVKQGNELIAIDDDDNEYPLSYVKINPLNDLALFEISNIINLPYLEISDVDPKIGSEVLVIGNPDYFMDVVSDGIIAKNEKGKYYITNVAYYGSSGGSVLYKGKIVGVVRQIYTNHEFRGRKNKYLYFMSYTVASDIYELRKFLGGIK